MTNQTSDDDDFGDYEVEESREWFDRVVATKGLRLALEAAMDVCADKGSTPQARANAASSIMRAAGVFDRKEGDKKRKEPHEMTGDELASEIEKLQRRERAAARRRDAGDDEGSAGNDGVFN